VKATGHQVRTHRLFRPHLHPNCEGLLADFSQRTPVLPVGSKNPNSPCLPLLPAQKGITNRPCQQHWQVRSGAVGKDNGTSLGRIEKMAELRSGGRAEEKRQLNPRETRRAGGPKGNNGNSQTGVRAGPGTNLRSEVLSRQSFLWSERVHFLWSDRFKRGGSFLTRCVFRGLFFCGLFFSGRSV